MTDRPILFTGPMVRTILDGRKTQTRRVLKPQPKTPFDAIFHSAGAWWTGDALSGQSIEGLRVRYAPGDRLWVREKHWCVEVEGGGIGVPFLLYDDEWTEGPGARMPCPKELRDWVVPFRKPDPEYGVGEPPWGARPSIHMPRWASRLTLIVEEVRVQRLKDISEEDALAEGVDMYSDHAELCKNVQDAGYPNDLPSGSAVLAVFRKLWDSLNAKRGYGWDENPWVVALTFRTVKANIDSIEADHPGGDGK